MPFETQGPEPLDAVINVRLTAAEKARLKEDADLAGLSMSELVRRRYFGRPIIANADAVMLKELRRIGGLLKHIHNESGGVYSKETAGALLAEIKENSRKDNRCRSTNKREAFHEKSFHRMGHNTKRLKSGKRLCRCRTRRFTIRHSR
jgi:hypothetical protein